ncbi:membrane dipeptidase [Streptomyces vilmorinianum]|uniref:membrane dipeptidase n=1 Tax=Streptomyces vilmorinianum TaxID=3051092 RepID=UPI0010FB54C1|nr:membrane dipeptidase [Streptomyces vilmorinianum]
MADLDDHHPFSVARAGAASGELDTPEQPRPLDELTRARALLAAQAVVEGHTEPPRVFDPDDLPPVRAAEAGAQLWSLRVDPDEGVIGTLRRIDAIHALVAACPEDLRLAHSTAEMAHAVNCGRVAVLLGPVSWSALGGSLAALRAYHALGVRAVNLTRFDGFAREAVREMNRLGLIVDLAGADPETIRRTLALTRAPVLLTRADPQELPDDVLRLLGENGGVCMLPVTDDVQTTADAFDRVRTLAGPHCVGLSHTTSPPDGYAPLVAELLHRAWPAPDLVALAHTNPTRALRETEFLSRTTRHRRAA